ncbi:MAG: hypothetical protein Q8862_03660 [Bacteroidota bacterium]|nr:hypothetical protein [Bacteroidota bacterium]
MVQTWFRHGSYIEMTIEPCLNQLKKTNEYCTCIGDGIEVIRIS